MTLSKMSLQEIKVIQITMLVTALNTSPVPAFERSADTQGRHSIGCLKKEIYENWWKPEGRSLLFACRTLMSLVSLSYDPVTVFDPTFVVATAGSIVWEIELPSVNSRQKATILLSFMLQDMEGLNLSASPPVFVMHSLQIIPPLPRRSPCSLPSPGEGKPFHTPQFSFSRWYKSTFALGGSQHHHAAKHLCSFQILLQTPYFAPSQPAVAQLTALPSGCHVWSWCPCR